MKENSKWLYGTIGLFVFLGFIPFFADVICQTSLGSCPNFFMSPWALILWTLQIFWHIPGEDGMVVLILGPFIYTIVGIVLGFILYNIKSKPKSKKVR